MTDPEKAPYYLEGVPTPDTPEPGETPKPWQTTQFVGKSLPRVDAYERVSGSAVYPADVTLPKMLYGAILRCLHPHARVKGIYLQKARRMPGVHAVIGVNTPEADVVLAEDYRTECEIHVPLEPHGCAADWDGDRLAVWESNHGVYRVQSDLAEALKMPLSKVRVIGRYMGGGFGSKLQAGKYTVIAALLARIAARPIKLTLSREETYLAVGNRPPANMHLKAGVKKDGRLAALELTCSAAEVASPQLRNQGTIGGNLCQKPRCWYYRGEFKCLRKGGGRCYAVEGENRYHCIFGGENCYIVHPSDTAPALAALDAAVTIEGPKGGRRSVPLEAFFVPPSVDYTVETVLKSGEIVTEILLPPPAAGLRSAYRKVRARQSWDFALAGMASAVVLNKDQVRHCRMILSGAAPVPWRLPEAEAVLTGRRLDADSAAKAAEAALAKAEPMTQNAYKVPLFRAVIRQELLNYLEQ